MQSELMLRIVLEKPFAGVDYCLQKGAGTNYETIQKQRANSTDLSFEFSVGIKDRENPIPIFVGPFTQGKPQERFIYIDIGICAGQTETPWSRRLKIPLADITWDILNEALVDDSSILEAKVPGIGKDGGPSCATVKPFNGWKLVNR
jgi:hypothetical protein